MNLVRTRASRSAGQLAIGFFALAAVGCSTFDRDFDVAVAHGPYTDITGPWEGRWRSDVDGHDGRLRCLLKQVGEHEYEGRFQARYHGVFVFEHQLPMQATETAGGKTFEGRAALSWYGDYEWSGQIVGDEFTAQYRALKDHGTFTMTRPGRPLPGVTTIGAEYIPPQALEAP